MRAQLAANLRVVACRRRDNPCYYTIDYVVPHSRVLMGCGDDCGAGGHSFTVLSLSIDVGAAIGGYPATASCSISIHLEFDRGNEQIVAVP
jgi:hypothetical protein